MRDSLLAEILQLSVDERIQLVEEIWDSIAAHPDQIPITEEQMKELDRRDEEFEKNPGKCFTWEEVKALILEK